MFKKILKIAGWIFSGLVLAGSLAFTSLEVKDVKCEGIEVVYYGKQVISLDEEVIVRLVKAADGHIIGKNFKDINTEKIEAAVEKNKTIENAEVYKVVAKGEKKYKGLLAVKVKHRIPVLRVMSEDGSYYLDKNGIKVPVSTKYAANVLVATGRISQDFAAENLLPFIGYLNHDEFWKAQIQQVYVSKNKDLILTPLVGNFSVNLGPSEGYEEKLENLKAFYEQVLAKNNWNTYSNINVKYKNQVIATKK